VNLLLDRRCELRGKPGFHAFLVGVSQYNCLKANEWEIEPAHLGMMSLKATSLAAFRVAQWLMENRDELTVPLVTCRLLLSPTDAERERISAAASIAYEEATFNRFLEHAWAWRHDASTDRENFTLFYFAGHGVQRYHNDHVMLLQNFGHPDRPLLNDAVDTFELLNGMATSPQRGRIAQRQIYFIDACRSRPDAFSAKDRMLHPPQIWVPDALHEDPRRAPVFFTTGPGQKAHEVTDQGTIFSIALLECLNGVAGIQPTNGQRWCITVGSLEAALRHQIDELQQAYHTDQNFRLDGVGADFAFHKLPGPPPSNVRITVHPPEGGDVVHIRVRDERSKIQWRVPRPVPIPADRQLAAGHYIVETRVRPPTEPFVGGCRIFEARPPRSRWPIRLSPSSDLE
jgi:hypothetical protein